MRIIKLDEIGEHPGKINPMVFPAFSEDGVLTVGGNGGKGAGEGGAEQPEINLEQVRREAEELKLAAAAEAENIRELARKDAEKTRVDAEQEAQKIREQTAKEVEIGKKEGYSTGYSSGEEEGYKKGYDEGFTKGKNKALEEMQATINMMNEVVEQLKAYRREILADSQTDIAKMALSVARKILQKEIMTDPMTVVSVVKGAVAKVSFKKRFMILVNPLDLEVIQSVGDEVRAMLDSYDSLEFKASAQVEAGGCVVQTESGTVDAQIDRQVNEVEAAVMKAMGDDND